MLHILVISSPITLTQAHMQLVLFCLTLRMSIKLDIDITQATRLQSIWKTLLEIIQPLL